MKLLCVFGFLLAVALAKETKTNNLEDLEATATDERITSEPGITRIGARNTFANYYPTNLEGSSYAPPYVPSTQTPPRPWNPSPSNYIPSQNIPTSSLGNYVPSTTQIPPVNNYIPSQSTVGSVSNYIPNQSTDSPAQNYFPIQNDPPQNSWNQQNIHLVRPQNNPQNNYVSPQNSWNNNNNWNNWNNHNYPTTTVAPVTMPPSTQTVAVIKNEQTYGDNGSYKYEYQIADGTHVGEEGYFTNPKADDESLVKRGWYSFTDTNGKVYTIKYWADSTGYHAVGDHLPTPPPTPPAIQAAIDQIAKEEAAKAEADKIKPHPFQPTYPQTLQPHYPQPTQKPQQIYYPQQTPNLQQPYYPQQTQKPQQVIYPQQTQQIYHPQQQQIQYPPHQQTHYPQQQQQQQTFHPHNDYSSYGK